MRWFMMVALALTFSPVAADAAAKSNCRDARTGTYVTKAYAKKFPKITVCEKV
jgi:hypothetical protein